MSGGLCEPASSSPRPAASPRMQVPGPYFDFDIAQGGSPSRCSPSRMSPSRISPGWGSPGSGGANSGTEGSSPKSPGLLSRMSGSLVSIGSSISSKTVDVAQNAASGVQNLPSKVAGAAQSAATNVASAAQSAAGAAHSAASNVQNAAIDAANNVPSPTTIVDAASGIFVRIYIGSHISNT